MYGCESWTIKKAEHWRIDAFELWCWRRLLRVPWTARRSYQSILKKISPEYSLEGLMLKLKLQYFGHLMQRTDLFEKTLMLGKIDDRRRRGWGGWMSSPTQLLWVWESSRSWWWAGKPSVLQSMGSQRVRHNWATELNWIELNLLQSLDPAVFNSRVSPYWTSSISSIIVCIPTSNSHAFYLLNSDPVAPWGFAGPGETILPVQFSSVQLLSCIRLFATPWIPARQASLSITNSQSLPKLMSIKSMMPSSHVIFCRPLLLLPPVPPSIRVFSNESTLHMRWPKY